MFGGTISTTLANLKVFIDGAGILLMEADCSEDYGRKVYYGVGKALDFS